MRGKVLIVDDYSDWRELLSGLMEREGHLIEALSTREEALGYIAENKDLDLAILDIRLVDTEKETGHLMGSKNFLWGSSSWCSVCPAAIPQWKKMCFYTSEPRKTSRSWIR